MLRSSSARRPEVGRSNPCGRKVKNESVPLRTGLAAIVPATAATVEACFPLPRQWHAQFNTIRQCHARRLTIALAVLAIVIPTAAYVGGYLGLCKLVENSDGTRCCRLYAHDWQATIFKPAGWMESKLTGVKIIVVQHPLSDIP